MFAGNRLEMFKCAADNLRVHVVIVREVKDGHYTFTFAVEHFFDVVINLFNMYKVYC